MIEMEVQWTLILRFSCVARGPGVICCTHAHFSTFRESSNLSVYILPIYGTLTVLPMNGVCFHKYFFNLELYSQHIEAAL